MPALIVRPPLSPAHAGVEHGWALLADDGRTLLSHGSAPLALLPAGDEVTVLVPGAALSWHTVTLPQGNLGGAARLRSVLDGLLEERLLDEPEALHFALEPGAKPGATVWVAASQRIALRAAVQALEAAGRRVTRIVPEFAPQPDGAPALLFATGEPEAAQLTICDASGVATLPLNAAGLALVGSAPLDTAVASAEPAVAAMAEALLGQRLPIAQAPERWLQAARAPWDLAQFDLASSGRARAGKKFSALLQTLRHAPQWRAARWGAVALVLAQLIGLNAWAWKERSALDAKRGSINAMLTQTFPSVKLVVDAPVQMAREVAVLQQATGGVAALDLEPMLVALAASLPRGRVPNALDYSAGQLRLRGLNLSADELTGLSNTLAPRGYSARSEGDLLLVQAEATR
ncbi:type II secretion system protein GspL [Variovorax fucosicus]|uniref:type II secretion system protein GspL n=1 Tax=Variovorax fucosicus TaxID=3053517 RepID=UPI002574A1A3|nr:type II secretion system protein GspL [Variovorax sp. J22G47]MDM0056053.1 type II secretion system protein GspL [Variovorax sp. J22G47]